MGGKAVIARYCKDGEHLTRIVRGGLPRRIAPKEEVLALKPNLQSPQ